ARCVSTGAALPIAIVEALWQAGLRWGQQQKAAYIVLGECVAGGTTTALAVLLGLGWAAEGMVSSSHPVANHAQKRALVQQGLRKLRPRADAFEILAAVGDPVQPFVAAAAAALSQTRPVLLAGGTQMLAIYALLQRLAAETQTPWQPDHIVVGTTRWVVADPTGNTVGLAQVIGTVPLLSTSLSFRYARYPQLAAYEQGYVKEGVGAGGLAISASLYRQWGQLELLTAIEATYARLLAAA
ncbi:MAG: TIGR00303 family protein, partial [Synechococcaceae cyanobacterium SM2_3_60]|nr:TIGR00303 family protein [Synechococcaceae cyanobacterium SM2_3_60]